MGRPIERHPSDTPTPGIKGSKGMYSKGSKVSMNQLLEPPLDPPIMSPMSGALPIDGFSDSGVGFEAPIVPT